MILAPFNFVYSTYSTSRQFLQKIFNGMLTNYCQTPLIFRDTMYKHSTADHVQWRSVGHWKCRSSAAPCTARLSQHIPIWGTHVFHRRNSRTFARYVDAWNACING